MSLTDEWAVTGVGLKQLFLFAAVVEAQVQRSGEDQDDRKHVHAAMRAVAAITLSTCCCPGCYVVVVEAQVQRSGEDQDDRKHVHGCRWTAATLDPPQGCCRSLHMGWVDPWIGLG